MGYGVYILRCSDGTLYTGSAADVSHRFAVHQSGKGAKYTRSRLPVELVYREAAESRSAALRREAAIKKMSRKQKLELIAEALQNKCCETAPEEDTGAESSTLYCSVTGAENQAPAAGRSDPVCSDDAGQGRNS